MLNKKFIILIGLLTFLVLFYSIYSIFLSNSINTSSLSKESLIQENKTTIYYSLYKQDGYLYKSSRTGLDGVMEFLNKNPRVNSKQLFSSTFAKTTTLKRLADDKTDDFLKKQNINLTNEHYFFDQKIQGIPVYGAEVSVHLKNGKEIYSVDGNLVTNQNIGAQKITEEKAKQIALDKAYKEVSTGEKLKVGEIKKYIFNKKILGYDEDNKNYLTLEARVDTDGQFKTFSTSYFIDLENGEIIYVSPKILNAINREVYRCAGGSCNGASARGEGGPATGDSDADKLYDFFGDIYKYYSDTFGRDSYDNRGATLKGYVHVTSLCSQGPNAAWTGSEMLFCDNMVTKDIAAHEMTHAVTNLTANLEYSYQSGALNESISDIFGYAVDNDDWGMGEGSVLGIIRYLDDPTKMGQPDRLFASNYHCSSSDYGGVHKNSGVMNKAFYLMVTGGNFNGCSINGVGELRAETIVYKALTTRLRPSSDFEHMQKALIDSCRDLQYDQSVCDNIKAALQATEMDQQPANQQTGAKCGGAQPATPVCAGGAAPTNPPDSNITPTGSSTVPTTAPLSYMISGSVKMSSGSVVTGAKLLLSGDTSGNVLTDTSGNYSFDNLDAGNYYVTLEYNGRQKQSDLISLTTDLRRMIVPFIINDDGTIDPPIKITPTNTPSPTSGLSPTSRPGQSPTSGVSPTSSASVSPTTPPDGGGGGGGDGDENPTDGPTPSPIPYTCVPDQKCLDESGQNNIQLCPLKCTPL
ncbi:MAG: M4 family metallopeptidase [Candidatus Levybacteria bacterium]|nr:M4 family metallopeptidase [Candidatus Levybacteria bacterium]